MGEAAAGESSELGPGARRGAELLAAGRGQSPGWGRRDRDIVGSAVCGGRWGRVRTSAPVCPGRGAALAVRACVWGEGRAGLVLAEGGRRAARSSWARRAACSVSEGRCGERGPAGARTRGACEGSGGPRPGSAPGAVRRVGRRAIGVDKSRETVGGRSARPAAGGGEGSAVPRPRRAPRRAQAPPHAGRAGEPGRGGAPPEGLAGRALGPGRVGGGSWGFAWGLQGSEVGLHPDSPCALTQLLLLSQTRLRP